MFIETRTLKPKNSSKNKKSSQKVKNFSTKYCKILFFNNKTASLVNRNLVLSLKTHFELHFAIQFFTAFWYKYLKSKKFVSLNEWKKAKEKSTEL